MTEYYIYFTETVDGFLGCVSEAGRENFVEHLKKKHRRFCEIKIGLRYEEGVGKIREDSKVTNYIGHCKGVVDERIRNRVQDILDSQ